MGGAGMLRLRERMEQGGLSTSLPDIRLGQEGGSLANLASKALDNQRGHQATQRWVEEQQRLHSEQQQQQQYQEQWWQQQQQQAKLEHLFSGLALEKERSRPGQTW